MVLVVGELAAGGFTVKLPVDLGAGALDGSVPGTGFAANCSESGDSPSSKALPREKSNFDFCWRCFPLALAISGIKVSFARQLFLRPA